jgi:hypothetical protein
MERDALGRADETLKLVGAVEQPCRPKIDQLDVAHLMREAIS